MHNHDGAAPHAGNKPIESSVCNNYFSIKDALVKSDGASAAAKAKALSNAIAAVENGIFICGRAYCMDGGKR
jgi:hypothetical protein